MNVKIVMPFRSGNFKIITDAIDRKQKVADNLVEI